MKVHVFGVLFVALFCGVAAAGNGTWTSEGPWGGTVHKLLINPANPNILYASASGGLFRSNDGGVTWVRKQAGLTGWINLRTGLALDAEAPNTLWTIDSTGYLVRSTDAGENWARTGYKLSGSFQGLVVDAPGSTGKLYVSSYADPLMVSTDNGVTFQSIGSGLPAGIPIQTLAIDPGNPDRLMVGTYRDYAPDSTAHSIYLSTDGGQTWTGVKPVMHYSGTDYSYESVSAISFGVGNAVYASIDIRLYRSSDGGVNWAVTSLPPTGSDFAITTDPNIPGRLFIGSLDGVQISGDGGDTATPLNNGLALTAGRPAAITQILLHPNYPATRYLWVATGFAGVYFSNNDGALWSPRVDRLAGPNIRALAIHHDASTHRLLAGYGDPSTPSPALFRGDNAGPGTPFNWSPLNTGLDAYQIRSVVIDPTTTSGGIGSARVYASGAGRPTSGLRNGGLYRSLDGGNTWSTMDNGLPLVGGYPYAGLVRTLILDPRSCSMPPASGPCVTGPLQTLYATANGMRSGGVQSFRIMKSTDGGNSWNSSESGIPQEITILDDQQSVTVIPLVINPVDTNILYAGTVSYYFETPPTIASGVFKSTDGGANWVHKSQGLPRIAGSTNTAADVLSLAINPANPDEIWCSVFDMDLYVGGIYHSIDAGETWTNSSTGLMSVDIRAIYVDPNNPSTLYASGGGTDTNPGNIYKSTNSGATWQSISVGLPADAALALLQDPVDNRVLYAGTTSGLWSLTQMPDADGDGVPDAVEMAAPNGGDGNNNGIPDHLESNVGSLTSATTPGEGRPAALPSYFTVAVSPISGTCTKTEDVQSVYAAYHGIDRAVDGDRFVYPYQLARFEIRDCAEASVTIKFHGARFGASDHFRFYGPATPGDPETMGWHSFSSRATRIGSDTWRLTLKANAFGNIRPGTAGSILFEGGPGWKAGLFRDDFD